MTTNMEKTMSENMTIESFFLADYQRLKNENDELKAQIQEYELEKTASTSDCGFTDLGKKTEAIICDVASSYSSFGNDSTWGKLDVEQLANLAEMEDEALLEKAKTANQRWGGKVYEEEKRTFPFTVEFATYKGRNRYAYDPDKHRTDLVIVEEEADTNSYVNASLEAECRAIAAEEIREMIRDRINQLNNTKDDEDANQ